MSGYPRVRVDRLQENSTMNRMTRLCSIGLLLGATILIAASRADAQRRPSSRRPRGPQLKVGQVAPEIELLPLVFKKNEKGESVGVIGTKKIKLSTFRGAAPVVIFSSSYT